MQQFAPALVEPTYISADLHKNRICHVLSASYTFNDREQYPIFDSGAMRYGPSTMYHGFLCGSA